MLPKKWQPSSAAATVHAALGVACALLATNGFAGDAPHSGELHFENAAGKAATSLAGTDSRLQLLVTRHQPNGMLADRTRDVEFQASPDDVVTINGSGLVTPLADGQVSVTATDEAGRTATTRLDVSGTDNTQPVSFRGQVVPIFTKLGCNGGGCHGKIAGQNGFRLSLLGFEPHEDYKRLVAESRGRRVSIAAPDRSLLLQKTVNAMPHGGGARTDRDSHEYRVLRRWISQGMPYDPGQIVEVNSIRVFPESRRMTAGSTQQLSVIATYSDGRVEDVTRAAVFESNDPQMAEVRDSGLVKIGDLVGDVAVMARYQGQVTVFRAEIPLHIDGNAEFASDLTNPVDRLVRTKLASLGIAPSPPCDDLTYLRRVTLDVTGRLPTLEETEGFLADADANKRERLVDRLLASDDYAAFFARKWSVILRNRRAGGSLQVANVLFHHWLEDSLRRNQPYDDLVDELLTASGTLFSNPATSWLSQVTDQNERVEDISQLFLGQRIQCARCHHHPYEKWSQEDYARLSAFFSTVTKKSQGADVSFVTRVAPPSAKHPKTGKSVAPAGLDADVLNVEATVDPRQALSDWITSPDNRFFAKSLANRYWKHFMGRGLVEPEDDMRVTNPPSNPELMEALADRFIASGYDLKGFVRLIVTSQTYAASSEPTEDNIIDRRSYSRFYPKRMTAETLLDSIDHITGSKTTFAGMPAGTRAVELPDTGFDSYFLSVFGQPDSKTACECERSTEANLAQSLHLLNSEEMQGKLGGDQGRAATYASDASRTTEEKVRELYKLAFSRLPTDQELKTTLEYLGQRDDQQEPWEDLIWALLNSKEFLFIH